MWGLGHELGAEAGRSYWPCTGSGLRGRQVGTSVRFLSAAAGLTLVVQSMRSLPACSACNKHHEQDPHLRALFQAENLGPCHLLPLLLHRSTFELARSYGEVIGIDLSQTFIDMANRMKTEGQVGYELKVEGEIAQQVVAQLDKSIDAGRCTFLQVRLEAVPRFSSRQRAVQRCLHVGVRGECFVMPWSWSYHWWCCRANMRADFVL